MKRRSGASEALPGKRDTGRKAPALPTQHDSGRISKRTRPGEGQGLSRTAWIWRRSPAPPGSAIYGRRAAFLLKPCLGFLMCHIGFWWSLTRTSRDHFNI